MGDDPALVLVGGLWYNVQRVSATSESRGSFITVTLSQLHSYGASDCSKQSQSETSRLRLQILKDHVESYFGSLGLFGRLLVRSLFSVPPDGRSGPEPGLTRLRKIDKWNKKKNTAWKSWWTTTRCCRQFLSLPHQPSPHPFSYLLF